MKQILKLASAAALLVALALAVSCAQVQEDAGPDVDALKTQVISNYVAGVYATYVKSLNSAQEMDTAIDTFLNNPTPATLEAAKRAWLRARDDYGPTEVFRFYGGPIDNEEDGPEGLLNAWPLDEAYIDYVEGDPSAGIINKPDEFPTIDRDLIVSLNEEGGEANVSTGWHAIEFLLWGQDMNSIGPGSRPVEDYTTNMNADRRSTYLAVTSDTLLEHLRDMVAAWAPGQANYRADFVAMPADEALANVITGAGALSKGELAGRANVRRILRALRGRRTLLLLGQYPRRHSWKPPSASRWWSPDSTARSPGRVFWTCSPPRTRRWPTGWPPR